MSDVSTMVRTTQAVWRMKHLALCIAAGVFVGLFWALFLLVIWRAI